MEAIIFWQTQAAVYNVHLLRTAVRVAKLPKHVFPAILEISWRMRRLAYNVRKSITVAPAIKRLTPA